MEVHFDLHHVVRCICVYYTHFYHKEMDFHYYDSSTSYMSRNQNSVLEIRVG